MNSNEIAAESPRLGGLCMLLYFLVFKQRYHCNKTINSTNIPLSITDEAAPIQAQSTEAKENTDFRVPQRLSSISSHLLLEELYRNTDMFLFDCDGVIWKGDKAIDRAKEALEYLRSIGKKVLFVTNNSTKSRSGCLKKFTSLGIQAETDEIFSSSYAVAAYLQMNPIDIAKGEKVYVVGMEGICQELELAGIPYKGGPSDVGEDVYRDNALAPVDYDPLVSVVVVGLDLKLNYYKVQYAQLCLNNNKDCRFIATNLDKVAHLTDSQEWASGGSTVGCIKGCSKREPIILGKPSSLIVDLIANRFKVERHRICMVGDRLDTDVLFGLDNGLTTVLALSGVTSESDLNDRNNNIKPHFYFDSIADFILQ